MTLSTPGRLDPLRGIRPAEAGYRRPGSAVAPDEKPIPLPATRQQILSVVFSSPDGRNWQAIGGGNTLGAAIAFARDSCPTDTTWQPVSWNDLHGD
jgi:hypothetical protein